MDIQPTTQPTQPMSDDQELAKALAGVAADPEPAAANPMQFEETPVAGATPAPVMPATTQTEQAVATAVSSLPEPTPSPVAAPDPLIAPVTDLDGVKKSALDELRPLIDRVDLPPEEKFDTYLMLIRSTDDKSLIEPAHTAAVAITDEKRKAEALLDIIKEIDYLSRPEQPATS